MAARVLVFVPVSDQQAALIASGDTVPGPLQGFTVNEALLEMFGLTTADDERADFACLLVASIWGLINHGRRLVLTAQIDPELLLEGDAAADGGCRLTALPHDRVEAWFADDESAPASEVAELVAGLDLDEAWEHPGVAALLAEHDLMWHSVVELPTAFDVDTTTAGGDPAAGEGAD